MATINIAPTTASFTATGGQGTITLTDTASASWHDTPQSGDNWAAIREKENGAWSDWFVFGKNGVSGAYLPLTGGTMTGSIVMPAGSLTKEYGYKFGSGGTVYGQLTANSSGLVGIYAAGNIVLRPENDNTKGLVISTSDVTFNGTSILGGSVDPATIDDYGTVKIAAKRSTSPTLTTGGTTTGRYYGVEMRSDGRLFTNVPWPDVSWGNVSGSTAQLTVGSQTKTLLLSTYTPDLSGCVTITGTQTISGTKTFSATNLTAKNILPSSSGYNLGSSSKYWGKIYLGKNGNDDVYIEYDSTNKCVRVYGAGIATDSYISAGGVSTT